MSMLGFAPGPALWIAAVLALLPLLVAGFFSRSLPAWIESLPLPARLLAPSLLCVPYALTARSLSVFRWEWFALYALLPAAVAVLPLPALPPPPPPPRHPPP